MIPRGRFPFLALAAASVAVSGCTVIKPIACAAVFPFQQFARATESGDPEQKHSEMPAAGVIVAAPILIPLRYVYYVSYGAVGGLVSGFISDLNLITGHGSWQNSRRMIYRPMRTNAVK